MPARRSNYTTSRTARFVKLGTLSGKVGSSYVGQALQGAFVNAESKTQSLLETNARNALRVARTFGELKGAVMKVGQMLSLQEDLLPVEVRDILRGLQNHAPAVEFEQLLPVLQSELGTAGLGQFSDIATAAYASASIGQVHRARLRAGPEVAVKIQYPGVPQMVESDLKNLRLFTRSLRAVLPIKAELGKFLWEVRAKLTEELDYRVEAGNMLEFEQRFAGDPRFVIPHPFQQLSTRRVLTSEFQPGASADELCAATVPQQRRDQAGTALLDAILTQVFVHRTLQADPNLANFAFRDDGRIVMYDFGCVKRFTPRYVEGLRALAGHALAADYAALSADLERLGYVDLRGQQLPLEVYRAYTDAICGAWRRPGLYDFAASTLRRSIIDLNKQHWKQLLGYDAPADDLFLKRTFGGMFGNLIKLRARVPVHDLLRKHLDQTRRPDAAPVAPEREHPRG